MFESLNLNAQYDCNRDDHAANDFDDDDDDNDEDDNEDDDDDYLHVPKVESR